VGASVPLEVFLTKKDLAAAQEPTGKPLFGSWGFTSPLLQLANMSTEFSIHMGR